MAQIVGTGTTVTFGTSGYSAIVLSVSADDTSVEPIETTHMGSTTKTYVAGELIEPGTYSMECAYEGTDPTIGGTAETVTIDWGGSGQTTAASSFVTSISRRGEIEGRVLSTITGKFTGAIT